MPGATGPLPEERPVIDEIVAAGFEFERDASGWGFCHLDDRALKQVKRLKSIAFLDLFEVCDVGGVTGAGLANLAGNRSLVRLRLGPGINDAALAHLAGLVQLRELRLDSAEAVSDAGMNHLKRLNKLEVLSVQYTQVGDGGLAAVAHLSRLQELVLCHTKVTDAGLANLAGMTGLSSLALSDTAVTDAGIGHLSGLEDLKSLWLDGAKITDAAVPLLSRCSALTRLLLSRTGVTKKGIRAVKAALPECEVS